MKNTENKNMEALRAKELRLTAIYQSSGKIEDMDKLIKAKMDIAGLLEESIKERELLIESITS